jgi:transposase
MKTLLRRCAGLDVHKVEIVACLRLVEKGKVARRVRRFPTTTQGLLELVEWLEGAGCSHVAMEATGVYWKPVWHILDGHFALILANATHVKAVPGRKSDVNDGSPTYWRMASSGRALCRRPRSRSCAISRGRANS